MNLNKVILIGRISQQPIMNDSKLGSSYTRTSIAVNRESFGPNKNEITDFLPIVAFGNNANFLSKYFNKGDLVSIVGSIQTSQYTTKNGDVVSNSSIVVDQIKSLEPIAVTQARAQKNSSMIQGENYSNSTSTQIEQPNNFQGNIDEPTFYEEENEKDDNPWELDF